MFPISASANASAKGTIKVVHTFAIHVYVIPVIGVITITATIAQLLQTLPYPSPMASARTGATIKVALTTAIHVHVIPVIGVITISATIAQLLLALPSPPTMVSASASATIKVNMPLSSLVISSLSLVSSQLLPQLHHCCCH